MQFVKQPHGALKRCSFKLAWSEGRVVRGERRDWVRRILFLQCAYFVLYCSCWRSGHSNMNLTYLQKKPMSSSTLMPDLEDVFNRLKQWTDPLFKPLFRTRLMNRQKPKSPGSLSALRVWQHHWGCLQRTLNKILNVVERPNDKQFKHMKNTHLSVMHIKLCAAGLL